MSIIQVRQIQRYIETNFAGLIDMSDCTAMAPDVIEAKFLSRGVAALSLVHLAGVSSELAGKAIVDGFDDNGLDAILFDSSEKLLYLVQSKWDKDGSGSMELGDVQKFIAGVRDLVHPRLDRFNDKIKSRAKEINDALISDRTRVVLVLAYTGSNTLSVHVGNAISDLLDSLNDTGDVAAFKALSQKELHKVITSSGEAIKLEVMLYEWGRVSSPYEAYYGQIKASDIAAWWQSFGVQLLASNIRNFLGETSINEQISATLSSTPQHFWYFNNGVTVLCRRITKKLIGGSDHSAGTFDVEDASVVNGAQTVGSLGTSSAPKLDEAMVPIRFISLENCPDGFSVSLTRAANTQNRIEARDFAALDPEQERLRVEMHMLEQKQYVYKSGSYTIAPTDGCTIDEAAVALACSQSDLGIVVQAKREIGKLYEDIAKAPYKVLFNPSLTAPKMWRRVQLQRMIQVQLNSVSADMDDRAQMVAVHGNRVVQYEVFRSLGALLDVGELDIVKQKIDLEIPKYLRALVSAIDKLFPNSYLNSLFKNSEKCHQLHEAINMPEETPEQLPLMQVTDASLE